MAAPRCSTSTSSTAGTRTPQDGRTAPPSAAPQTALGAVCCGAMQTIIRHWRSVVVVVVVVAGGWLVHARFARLEHQIEALQLGQRLLAELAPRLASPDPAATPERSYEEQVAEARQRLALRGNTTPSPLEIRIELRDIRREEAMRRHEEAMRRLRGP